MRRLPGFISGKKTPTEVFRAARASGKNFERSEKPRKGLAFRGRNANRPKKSFSGEREALFPLFFCKKTEENVRK